MKTAIFSLLFILVSCISSVAVAGGNDIAEVSIKKFKFIPAEITVKVGSKVRWTNKEKRQYHSVWFQDAGEKPSEYFFPDETFEHSFDKIGTFPYTCEPHPEMKGVVKVVE